MRNNAFREGMCYTSFMSLDVIRRYDFAQVSKWFAERADLILLLFDSYKLDVSDEFKDVIEHLKQHDDKVKMAGLQTI